MNLYSFVVSVHVAVAILGLGPLATLALLTSPRRRAAGAPRGMPPAPALKALLRLTRVSQLSLLPMIGTGTVLVVMVHGAFARQKWMMVSGALLVLLGAGTFLVRRYLKQALAPAGTIDHLARAHRALLGLAALVAAITWLMESKPF
ncbi:MAG TPA: hypothetical protein VHE13_13295 [Opitutus sp.]|nr:hypothetical protein [Opitutus sp.]